MLHIRHINMFVSIVFAWAGRCQLLPLRRAYWSKPNFSNCAHMYTHLYPTGAQQSHSTIKPEAHRLLSTVLFIALAVTSGRAEVGVL